MYGRLYERARAAACSNCRGHRCHPDPVAVAIVNRARSTA